MHLHPPQDDRGLRRTTQTGASAPTEEADDMYVEEQLARSRHEELVARAERERLVGQVRRVARDRRRERRATAVREAVALGRASVLAAGRAIVA